MDCRIALQFIAPLAKPTRPLETKNWPPFTFSSMDLTITGIEQIVLTTKFGFADVERPGGDLGERLHEADLFGFV